MLRTLLLAGSLLASVPALATPGDNYVCDFTRYSDQARIRYDFDDLTSRVHEVRYSRGSLVVAMQEPLPVWRVTKGQHIELVPDADPSWQIVVNRDRGFRQGGSALLKHNGRPIALGTCDWEGEE